jgi:endosialidase-like protein
MSIQELFHPNPFNLWCNNLTVEGTLTAPSFTPVITSLLLTGTLGVNGNVTFGNAPTPSTFVVGPAVTTTINGPITFNGVSTSTAFESFSGGIAVTGGEAVDNLVVTSNANISGTVSTMDLNVTTSATFNGSTNLNGVTNIADAQLSMLTERIVNSPIQGSVAFNLAGDGFNTPMYQFASSIENTGLNRGQFEVIDNQALNNNALSAVFAIRQPLATITTEATQTWGILYSNPSATTNPCFYVDGQGAVFSQGVQLTSSEEFKKNIIKRDVDSSLLKQLSIYDYHWLHESDSDPKQYGVIWQDINKVFPCVCLDRDNRKSVSAGGLSSLCLGLLKHAEERISKLEESLQASNLSISALQAQINLKQ